MLAERRSILLCVDLAPGTNLAVMAGFGKPNCRNFAHMAHMHGLNGKKYAKP